MQSHRFISSHLTAACLFALTGGVVSAKQLPEGQIAASESVPVVHFSKQGPVNARGALTAVYQPDFQAKGATTEARARDYLRANAAALGIADPVQELAFDSERSVGRLRVVRFRQVHQGYPVRNVQIDVSLADDGRVVFVANGYQAIDQSSSNRALTSVDAARSTARSAIGSKQANARIDREEWSWWVEDGRATLVRDVRLVAEDVVGYWSVLVDALSGTVLKREDLATYADGTGTVFYPDPLTSSGATYGSGGYTDGSDADAQVLNDEREPVTLRDITNSNGTFTLVGPWARCSDHESPTGSCTSLPNADFSITRANQQFELANIYYHVDTAMRYYNLTLGVNVRPSVNNGSVLFDPHGLSNADNSHYEGGGLQRLAFGDGGVDDGEDADVIIHELGHGLHDWITNGGLSQTEGLSEGTGDYFASSYNRSFGKWTPSDPEYFWMFHWDGHNSFWGGRITNRHTQVTYPNLGSPSPHIPGQYWASCNLLAHDVIGRDKMDRAMLLGLGLTNSSSNQPDAAQAILNAMFNNELYSTSDIHAVFDAYTRGQANNGCNYPVTEPSDPGSIFRNGFE